MTAGQSDWTFYHGTPDERTWDQPHGAAYGLHVGTEESARQALNARIGKPLEGDWDGTREYGKTLLSPYQTTGTERNLEAPHYPSGRATYSTGHQVPMDARPGIFPVRITGPMTNHPATPMDDAHANGRMRAQITRGQARRGYFYRNDGEDYGSVSAVVPSAAHLERVHPPREAARWQPSSGIFGPTTGLDQDLFDEHGRLRPDVRHCVMTRLDQCIRADSGLAGSDWQDWTRVYLLGGSVSEWAGPRPNGSARDLDVIVAVDLREAQRHSAFEGTDAGTAASALNAAFHRCFNDDHWRPSFGGTWALTGFCNQRAWDVTVIRPYAAYDLTHGRWAVRPPHLPGHSVKDFDPAVIAHAQAVLAEARAVLRMPEPLRTREARDLWEHVHAHRCVAFGPEGEGWRDVGNIDEKMLAYAPRNVWGKIRELAMSRTASDGLGELRGRGYCTEGWGGWQQGKCGTYATALIRMKPGLKMGEAGYELGGGDRHPAHMFAHDETHAYDSAGKHPLPYKGVHGDLDYNELNQEPEWFGLPGDEGGTEEDITDAQEHARRNRILEGGFGPRTAAAQGYLRNPYHGNPEFGGRPEWAYTWFHGTRGEPDFSGRRKYSDEAQRAALPPGQRKMNSGWTQPNQHLGIHFSPLHEVAHKFVGSVSSSPGALVHARLRFDNPAVFPSEEHLNIAMADWGSKHYPHWHDDKLNGNMAWSYGDQEGTRRDYSQAPDNPRERWHLSQKAQSILQWHPHMPEILSGFRRHLADQGHHGIVYGNSLEGPYETDAGRGGDASMKYIRKRENWPAGHPYSFSAIAHPDDIEVTHVEHVAPWRGEPQGDQRTWEDVSDSDEPDEVRDKVLDYHRQHGGELPGRTAAYVPASATGYGASRPRGGFGKGREHWSLPPEQRTGQPGEYMYRFQPSEFHEQTVREGIAPRQCAGHLPDDPGKTVYMTSDDHVWHARPEDGHPGTEEWLRSHGDDEYHRHYKIDVSGLPLVEDRTYTNPQTGQKRSWMATEHIGPERIQPHLPGSEHGVTDEWTPPAAEPKTAAWHPGTSGSDDTGVYLRFGHWPQNERSYSPAGGYHEAGVSAYDLDRHGEPAIGHGLDRDHEHDESCDEDCDIPTDEYGNDPQEEMRGRVLKAEKNRRRGSDQPGETGHLVRGEMSGVGYDGEPLLQNVRRVGDWIDHRHLFIPGAQPHRLARHPLDEDYEEPEEKPPSGHRNRTAAVAPQWHQWTEHEPNRAVASVLQDHLRSAYPELTRPLGEERTPVLRQMLHRASFIIPDEEGGRAWASLHPHPGQRVSQPATGEDGSLGVMLHPEQDNRLTLAHEAAHHVTIRRHALQAAARASQASGHRDPDPAQMDPDDRDHGEGFVWHQALMLDGAGHGDAAHDMRDRYPGAVTQVAAHRHARGLPRNFPGSGLSAYPPPDLSHLPAMPHEQEEAISAPYSRHRDPQLDLARNPVPGTRIWRGERRDFEEDSPRSPDSVGIHWSVVPHQVITGGQHEGRHPVIWQARVEHPQEQAISRSHPMWGGRHVSMDSEKEVRLRPGATVHVEGAWVGQPGDDENGKIAPLHPERNGPGWTWHPVGRHVPVAYRGSGATDYSDVGIHREAAAEEPAPRLYHGTRYNLSPGEMLEGGAKPANNPGVGRYEHVYMHPSPMAARAAGSLAYDEAGYQRGQPNVYEVEPLDHPERDPFTSGAVRSRRARVLRKVDPFTEPDPEAEGEGLHREAAAPLPVSYSHEQVATTHHFHARDGDGAYLGHAEAWERPDHVLLHALEVAPAARGRGIASQLVSDVVGHFPGKEVRLKAEPYGWPQDQGLDEEGLRTFYRKHGFEDSSGDETDMARRVTAAYRLPESEIGPLYHGTTEDRAAQILESGFKGGEGRHEGIVHLAPTPELARSYAEGRVKADGGGVPAILRVDKVRGVSAVETGFGDPALNRDAGAHYMDKHGEVLVLGPSAIHGISREASSSGGQQRPRRTPGSAMVYLDVPHGTVQPYAGQEGGRHVALAYLPRAIGDEDFARVVDRAREAATRYPPLRGTLGGHMTFPPGAPSGKRRVAVVPARIPGVHRLQQEFGEFDRAHYEQYTPHVTRAQLTGNDPDPEPHPPVGVSFTHVHVRRGDEVHSFPLTGLSPAERAGREGERIRHPERYKRQQVQDADIRMERERQDREDAFREREDATLKPWARGGAMARGEVHGFPVAGPNRVEASSGIPQVLYHVSPRRNRKSIQESGLRAEYAEGPEAVYLHAVPGTGAKRGYDTWRVDTSGLDVMHDPHETCRDPRCEFRGGGSYYTGGDVPPERLSLHAPPLTGRGRIEREAAVIPQATRLACLGNSIAADREAAFLAHACLASGGQISHGGVFATGGLTSSQVIAWHLADVIAAAPDACVVGPMTANNYAGGLRPGQGAADIEAAATALSRAGIMPVLVLEPPHADPGASAFISHANDWVSRYAARHGFPVADLCTPLHDGSGAWNTALSGDGIHPNAEGARLMGKVIAEALRGSHRKTAVAGYDLEPRSGMIYLDLPPGTVRLVPGGVEDSHITICYLGSDVSDKAFAEACRRAQAAAAGCPPMDGVLRGIDIFPPSKGSDGKVVAFVPAYVGGIGRLRRELEDLSASEHKDWKPHVTLAYLEEGDGLPAPHPAVPLRFTHLHVKRGDDVVSFPLTGRVHER